MSFYGQIEAQGWQLVCLGHYAGFVGWLLNRLMEESKMSHTKSNAGPFHGIKACVFDAYGTLLDVNTAALRCQDDLGEEAQPLAELWRMKQLQYTWLSSLMGHHRDFYEITAMGLDFALDTLGVNDAVLRSKLMGLYEVLDAYPEVP